MKHIYLDGSVDSLDMEIIFMACNRVTNLFDNGALPPTAQLGVLGSLRHLRRLALPLDAFLELCRLDAARALLENITHLEPFNTRNDPGMQSVCAHLSLMSHLTHLSIDSISHDIPLQTAL